MACETTEELIEGTKLACVALALLEGSGGFSVADSVSDAVVDEGASPFCRGSSACTARVGMEGTAAEDSSASPKNLKRCMMMLGRD